MATYSGRYPANTFKNLLNIDNSNAGIDATLRSVQDGEGTTCPLQLSSTLVNVTAFQYNGFTVSLAGTLTSGGAILFSGAYGFTATLSGTTSVIFPTGGTLATLAGTEAFTNKTITSPTISGTWTASGTITMSGSYQYSNTGLLILDTDGTHALTFKPGSNLSAARIFTLTTGDADRTLDISAGSTTISAAAITVLDDASVSAMVDTLGGASATGSGGIVRATSPVLVTPSLGVATGTSFNNITGIATQAECETGSDLGKVVTPGRQQFHPSACKGWIAAAGDGSAIDGSYNVSSLTDNGTGAFTVNWATDFSSTVYARTAGFIVSDGTRSNGHIELDHGSAAVTDVFTSNSAASAIDVFKFWVDAFGDQ